jgi:ATP-dependent helicase/nuclease subunit B
VFLLGLNDGLFPRVIREDAFLRDRDRRVIDTTLGYKIPEKLAGYDEEHLLFSAMVQAGRDHLVLSSERADDAGRPLAPSWYLAAWREAAERPPTLVEVPRRPREKPRFPPFDRIERHTPREAAVLAALVGAEVGTVADERTLAALTRARRFRAAVDVWSPALSPFDGAVGPPAEWLAEARARGYTASALQTYAECPWRFFVTDLLGIAPPADAEQRAGPTVREWGVLLHETLARAVRPGAPPVESIWREACGRYAREAGIGYPLVWELEVERTGRILAEVVADDRDELTRSGYTSIESEVTLSGVWDGVRAIPIRGRLDRVDAGAGNGLRVVDWKFRWTRSRERPDDPETAALRGQALQAPLYAALARQYARAAAPGAPVAVSVYEVRLRAWEGAIERVRYAPDAEAAARIRATVSALVDGIETGLFPMIPDTYCGRCEVAAACRRRHAPSRARAERDPRAASLAAIRRTPRRAGDGV